MVKDGAVLSGLYSLLVSRYKIIASSVLLYCNCTVQRDSDAQLEGGGNKARSPIRGA